MGSPEVTCYLCETNVTTDEDFCHGCGQSICQDCADKNSDMPFGMHDPEVHVEPEGHEDEEDDE